ncbi:baeRF3 domain-containing protein [Amycolatopsis alkalitolerans]|uniref:Uncharacterized protein n=1 Tax=Amycolatopsis alkalitolerans TaxID=2547244 RepID=A0A5C4LQU5_9PSEU|nr:hypothetical protein [Amycolatopsis alkalitolerans]TNC20471.1 hypothetical protein FG385_30920 [Amycolatopsis alkalitolerans]
MDTFTRQDLDTLIERAGAWSVSLYLPTHRTDPETRQDAVTLVNLARRAETELIAGGLRRPEAQDILASARALAGDPDFWRERGEGLAVFLRPGWWRAFRLPVRFGELVAVSDGFRVYPLLPLLTGDEMFFLLALSENEAKLYRGNRSGLQAIGVPDLPHGVKDALRYDEPEKQRGHHLAVRTVTHGQGIGGEVQKERLGRYLHAVRHAVDPVLAGRRLPLVLAGVDAIRGAYHEISGYPHLLASGVSGSPDRVPVAELHRAAWEVVGPLATRERDDAAARYEKAAGTGLTSDDAEEVAAAAESGRVETLFAAAGDLAALEPAAVRTIRTGGTVYVVPGAAVPGRGTIAAVFRY